MSAIFGIYQIDGMPVVEQDLERMSAILAHRGPDGSKLVLNRNLALGHRMLWTTPESLTEVLPFKSADGRLTITADARIDNRDQLIGLLGLESRLTEKLSDSEIILASYEKWAEQCPDKLLGDFAFAVWDDQKQSLFCARDHFGVKPFYYHSAPDFFAFASEIKALLCVGKMPRRLNEMRVADYLSIQFEDKEITFYEGILRLPPGHSLTVRRGETALRAYWTLDPNRELRLGSDQEYAEGFREHFVEAVKCRMRSAFPIGTMLSGGLDSSSVTCVARQLGQTSGNSLHTFSAVFNDVAECDERKYMGAVLSQNSVKPHYLQADRVSPLSDLGEVLWHQDEPLWSFNLFLIWNLYKPAKENGVRVILDGFDGDTTVSHGVDHLTYLATEGKWLRLAGGVRAYSRTFNLAPLPLYWSYLDAYKLRHSRVGTHARKFWRRAWRASLSRAGMTITAESKSKKWRAAIRQSFVERTGMIERKKAQQNLHRGIPSSEREGHFRNLNWGVMPYALEVLDKTAAAFSIDVRFPFWDRRLVEYCLSLPPEQKINRNYTRVILRRAMEGILPPEIQWRPDKSNMGPSFKHVLLTYEKERLEDAIVRQPEYIEDYFDVTALREIYRRFQSGVDDDDDMLTVWKALSLSLWLKQSALAE